MTHPFRTLLYDLLLQPLVDIWRKFQDVVSLPTPQTLIPDEYRPQPGLLARPSVTEETL
ncbi:MAG: hypothetical protein ACRD2Q_04520 [Terriglobales bacterium]